MMMTMFPIKFKDFQKQVASLGVDFKKGMSIH